MLQVIVFALIIGVILAKMGERADTVANFFSQFNDIMMEMTMMIMSLAPIGVFCLISRTFATIGFSAFRSAGKIHDRSTFGTCDPVSWEYIRFC